MYKYQWYISVHRMSSEDPDELWRTVQKKADSEEEGASEADKPEFERNVTDIVSEAREKPQVEEEIISETGGDSFASDWASDHEGDVARIGDDTDTTDSDEREFTSAGVVFEDVDMDPRLAARARVREGEEELEEDTAADGTDEGPPEVEPEPTTRITAGPHQIPSRPARSMDELADDQLIDTDPKLLSAAVMGPDIDEHERMAAVAVAAPDMSDLTSSASEEDPRDILREFVGRDLDKDKLDDGFDLDEAMGLKGVKKGSILKQMGVFLAVFDLIVIFGLIIYLIDRALELGIFDF